MSQWISIKTRLPEEAQEVLVYVERTSRLNTLYHYMLIAYIDEGEWSTDNQAYIYGDVIYWRPLPQPPEGYEE